MHLSGCPVNLPVRRSIFGVNPVGERLGDSALNHEKGVYEDQSNWT